MTTAAEERIAERTTVTIPQRIRVEVTQQDIDAGCVGNEHRCPVAQAVWRLFPDIQTVSVTGSQHPGGPDIDVLLREDPQVYLTYRAPEMVGYFMDDFDCHITVKPISFEAELQEVPALKGILRTWKLRLADSF